MLPSFYLEMLDADAHHLNEVEDRPGLASGHTAVRFHCSKFSIEIMVYRATVVQCCDALSF